MALTEERRKILLAYCKLSELAEDPEVQLLIPVFYADAVGYMEGAGVMEPTPGTNRASMYDLCVNAMVLDSWDNRDTKETTSQITENPAFRKRLNQLKRTEPVSNLDTSEEE